MCPKRVRLPLAAQNCHNIGYKKCTKGMWNQTPSDFGDHVTVFALGTVGALGTRNLNETKRCI